MYVEKLAENLAELLRGKNLSRVAKEIGLPQQTLYRYVHGEREIGVENLVKLADYFGEDVDVLIGRKI